MSVIAVLSTIVEANTDGFSSGMDRASQTTGKFAQAVNEQSQKSSASISQIGSAWGNVASATAGAAGGGLSKIGSMMQSAAAGTKSLLMGMVSGLLSAVNTVERLASVINTPFGNLGAGLQSITNQMVAFAAKGAEWGATLAGWLMAPLKVIPMVLHGLAEAVRIAFDLFTGLFQAAGSTFSSLVATVGAFFGAAGIGTALNSAVEGMAKAMSAMGRAIGGVLDMAGKIAGAVVSALTQVVQAIASTLGAVIGGAIGMLTGLGGAAWALAKNLHSMASAGAESIATISVLSKELGIGARQLSAFANTAGLNPEGFAHSMLHMQREISEGGTTAARALDNMNLSLAEMQEKSPVQQLEAIYGAFNQIADQGTRASTAMALFGRSGIQMLDSLSRGSEGLERARTQAERFGLTFTNAEASIVRGSIRAWGQLSLAFEGISRKLAVIFAPAWEIIGNIGGRIGESLVNIFSDSGIREAARGMWASMAVAAAEAWHWIGDLVSNFWRNTLGFSSTGADAIKDALMRSMITVEYAFRNLETLGRQAWNEVKLAGLKAWQEMLPYVNQTIDIVNQVIEAVGKALSTALSRGFRDGIKELKAELSQQSGPVARLWSSLLPNLSDLQNIERVRIPNIGANPGDYGHREQEIMRMQRVVDAGRSMIIDSFTTFMDNRVHEIGELLDRTTQANEEIEQAAASAAGRYTQPGGNGAAVAGTQEAFSVLNSRQADLNRVMEEHLEVARRSEQALYDLLQRFNEAPVVRAARY